MSYLQVSKRSCSARLPQFLNLTTSEVQQFCETSSICELDNVKIEAILRDFFNFSKLTTSKTKQFCETSFKNGKLRAELTASCQCAFRIFHSICLKYCLPGKSEAGSYEVLHLSRKIIFPKLKIWCFKMQPLSTSLMNMALVPPLPREIHLCRSSSNVPHLPSFWICYKTLTFCSLLARCRIPCACHTKRRVNVQKWREHVVFLAFWLQNVLRATAVYTFWTSQLPKVLWTWCALYILTWKCASPHSGAHFFNISTSKSVPNLSVLTLLTSKGASHHNGVHFFDIATSESAPNVRCFFCFFTCKRASCHNGVQLFISHLHRWLRTRRFSEPTFRPYGATNHWTNTVNRDFSTFSRTCIFFLLTLSLLWSSLFFSSLLWLFPPLLFHLSILSEVWLLNFLRISDIYILFIYIKQVENM